MRRLFGNRSWIILLSLVTLLALSILAVGLQNVSFRPGLAMGARESATIRFAVSRVAEQIQDVNWGEQLLIWGVLSLTIFLISLLMTPEGRRRLLRGFVRFAAVFWSLYFIMKYNRGLLSQLLFGGLAPGAPSSATAAATPLVFEPPQLSSAVVFAVSLGLAIALIGLSLRFNRWWTRRRASLRTRDSLKKIADIARSSLSDLSAGRDLNNVILDCYMRMSHVVEQQRGLSRQVAMTPAEFATRLERDGLPAEAVHGLTRLFEAVRYGTHAPAQSDVDRAMACLNTILHECGATVV